MDGGQTTSTKKDQRLDDPKLNIGKFVSSEKNERPFSAKATRRVWNEFTNSALDGILVYTAKSTPLIYVLEQHLKSWKKKELLLIEIWWVNDSSFNLVVKKFIYGRRVRVSAAYEQGCVFVRAWMC